MTVVHVVMVALAMRAPQQTAAVAADCREWHECRQLATSAYERGDYERFHDLAWRAVQTGPRGDLALMYLLARAQSLSGRPHDSLVMLDRLLDRGFVPDAATNDDFRAVRQLREWPELEQRLAGAAKPETAAAASEPQPSAVVTPPAGPPRNAERGAGAGRAAPPAPPAPSSVPVARLSKAEDALRVPGAIASAAGLAYDRVSSRFVVANERERKLVIIDERSRRTMDLVTASSAGFFEITGFEIDPLRGDLWVVSADAAEGDGGSAATALHKLQLVSGRPLMRALVPDALQPCRLADVAVTRDGVVFVLDALGRRVLRYEASTRAFAVVAHLRVADPTSLAPAAGRLLYVAHASGIVRVDTETGAVSPVESSPDVPVAGLEHIRWTRDSLVGVQQRPDGGRRAVRIRIVNGRAVSNVVLDGDMQVDGGTAATVSGDELYFVSRQRGTRGEEIVIRRSRIR